MTFTATQLLDFMFILFSVPLTSGPANTSSQHPLIVLTVLRCPKNLSVSIIHKKRFAIQILNEFLLKGYWFLTKKNHK